MKIFVVALVLLITASNADQHEQILQELKKLVEPVAHFNTPDENGPNIEGDKDIDASKDQPQAVQRNLNSHNSNTLFKTEIYNRIRQISQTIPDPYVFSNSSLSTYQGDYGFDASLQHIVIEGLSNINIDNINVKKCKKQGTIILSVPKVDVNIGSSGVDLTVFDSKLSLANNGTVSVNNIVIVIDVYIKRGHDTITNLGISLNFVGPVQSNLNVMLFGLDISSAANKFIEKIIHSLLDENKLQLQEILRDIVLHDLN